MKGAADWVGTTISAGGLVTPAFPCGSRWGSIPRRLGNRCPSSRVASRACAGSLMILGVMTRMSSVRSRLKLCDPNAAPIIGIFDKRGMPLES